MDSIEKKLKALGFVNFKHPSPSDRDDKKRLCWLQIVNWEIVTIRVVYSNNGWVPDYIKPEKYLEKLQTLEAIISFVSFHS